MDKKSKAGRKPKYIGKCSRMTAYLPDQLIIEIKQIISEKLPQYIKQKQ